LFVTVAVLSTVFAAIVIAPRFDTKLTYRFEIAVSSPTAGEFSIIVPLPLVRSESSELPSAIVSDLKPTSGSAVWTLSQSTNGMGLRLSFERSFGVLAERTFDANDPSGKPYRQTSVSLPAPSQPEGWHMFFSTAGNSSSLDLRLTFKIEVWQSSEVDALGFVWSADSKPLADGWQAWSLRPE
jgi:hypothetical protein